MDQFVDFGSSSKAQICRRRWCE